MKRSNKNVRKLGVCGSIYIINFSMCWAHGKITNCPTWGWDVFLPTNQDLAKLLGETDVRSAFVYCLYFSEFQIPRFLDFQIPRFPNSRLSAGMSRGQLAWGAIWIRTCWSSSVNMDVWACNLAFRLNETRESVTKYRLLLIKMSGRPAR